MSRYTIPDSDDDSCDSFMTTLTSKESQGQAPGAGGTIDISERQNACNVQAKLRLNNIQRPIVLNSESAAPAAHDEITVAVEGGVGSYRRRSELRNQTGGPEARGPMKRKSAGSSTGSAKGVNIGYQQNRDGKRRRTSGGFAPANPPPSNGPVIEHTPSQPSPGGPQPLRHNVDPLPGSRPTSILVGHWAKSNSPDPRDRHAVYGILGKNDIFRVKLVRETRDRRFFEGNFPAGAGALWIAYEEVAFEPHLKNLVRNEIKEYCRVRQYQIDMGEKEGERTSNETKAVYEAQARAAGTNYKAPAPLSIAPPLPSLPADYGEELDQTGRMRYFRHELRQSRRVKAAKAEARQSYIDIDTTPPQPAAAPRQSTGRTSLNNNAIERTSALAEREIARIELAQERALMQAANRKRAAAAAAQAAQAAGANIPGLAVDGRQKLHERDEIQRLNKVWARQESLRLRTNAEDAKMYAGVKYERKTQGPFPGELISQGSTINVDGEEYILYRVLVKP